MDALTGREIRGALLSCSWGERQSLTLPPLDDVPWPWAPACADPACSLHLRAALRPTRAVPDPAPLVAAQAAALTARLDAFVDRVLQG